MNWILSHWCASLWGNKGMQRRIRRCSGLVSAQKRLLASTGIYSCVRTAKHCINVEWKRNSLVTKRPNSFLIVFWENNKEQFNGRKSISWKERKIKQVISRCGAHVEGWKKRSFRCNRAINALLAQNRKFHLIPIHPYRMTYLEPVSASFIRSWAWVQSPKVTLRYLTP